MVAHSEVSYSPYLPEQLFTLVADIERYPEFLPWCSAARIQSKKGNIWVADLVITFKAFNEKYTSRVTLQEPDPLTKEGSILVEMISGPFTHLHNQWKFYPATDGGTRIEFELDFKFRSAILETLIGFMFENALRKMTEAFSKRAEAMYGVNGT